MPGFDDKLTRELERAARPAAPDVVRTFQDVTRRRAKRAVVRRVQVVAVVVAVLAGTAGAFLLLDDRFEGNRPVNTETIAPPLQQMSAWRLQFRPVIGTDQATDVSCLRDRCSEGDLGPDSDVWLISSDEVESPFDVAFHLGPAFADASDVLSAEVVEISSPGGKPSEWAVVIRLDADGTAALEAATQSAVRSPAPRDRLAVVLDGAVIQAPVVQEPVTNGFAQISGMSEEASRALAAELTGGPGTDVTPSDTPPALEGTDIGLGANWCEVQRLGGLDLLGDGTPSTAWTGYHVNADGRCPPNPKWYVAVDVNADGLADVAWGPIDGCRYTGCAPLGASDLDGDGDRELVIHTFFSVINHLFFSVRGGDEAPYVLEPIVVAEPGNPAADVQPGEPLMTSAAGDEGFASWMRCEGYPEGPVLVWTWTNHPVDSPEPAEWHETKLRLDADGMFHVVASDDFELDADQDPGLIRSSAPACGIDFNVWEKPNP